MLVLFFSRQSEKPSRLSFTVVNLPLVIVGFGFKMLCSVVRFQKVGGIRRK